MTRKSGTLPGVASESALLVAFPPIASTSARVLILGSMPGEESLRVRQYYAHPRNAFWPIMGELFGAGPDLPYAVRLEQLRAAGVGVWDVLAGCRRDGSLDSAIDPASVSVNDFRKFFRQHPALRYVFFNGAASEQLFRRHVLASLDDMPLQLRRLPSTSPAHAGLSQAKKLAAWRCVREACDR